MTDSKNKLFFGIAFIVIGILFLVTKLSDMGMSNLWPIFPLTVGAGLMLGYFKNRENIGYLMPGIVLITISILFFYCSIGGWHHMANLWPVFILAPSAGFVAMYFGGNRDRGLLMPAGLLGLIGLIFIAINFRISNFIPILMILIGIILVLSQMYSSKKENGEV
ncbi:hypothetical protein ACFL4L_03115 [bacterium]